LTGAREFKLPVVTRRIRIRRFETADLAAFLAYRADPEVGRYQGWSPMDAAASRAFLEQMARMERLVGGQWMQVAIADARTNLLLGDIGVHPDEDFTQVELGFTLAAQHQRRGLAAEAVGGVACELFRQTPVQSIRGVTDARNIASIALLERLGFRRVNEQQAMFRGEPCIEYVYVLASSEVISR
jgi:RimJ/RimL family protein N-acetyltransferase